MNVCLGECLGEWGSVCERTSGYGVPLTWEALPDEGASKKMALYCMMTSKRWRRYTSVRCLMYSYESASSKSSTSWVSHSSLHG